MDYSYSSDSSLVFEGVRFSLDVEFIPDVEYSDSEASDADSSNSSFDSIDSDDSHDSGISDSADPQLIHDAAPAQCDSGSDSANDDSEEDRSEETDEDDDRPSENVFYSICPECGIMIKEFETDMGGGVEAARLVNRLKNTNLDKFHSLCKMHLSFLLDLPGTALEDFLGELPVEQTPDKTSRSIFSFGKRKQAKENKQPENGIFGMPLCQDILDAIFPILEFLEQEENVCQEGLFRKSGHIGRQKVLREKLNAREDIQIELDSSVYSAHDCAGVLKTFLGELPEPLLTEKHYSAHCQVPDMILDKKQIQTTQLLVQLLPAENATLLQCLLHLLHLVSRQDSSKMTADTLGTLFAPHLLVPKKMTAAELQCKASNITRAVSFMIDRAPLLFHVPELLVRDIATYWQEMEEGADSRPGSAQAADDTDSITCRHRYRKRVDPTDVLINTKVTFADRAASQEAAANTDTQMALAQLYAHVSSMPESSKKRKLLKQFNKANGGICSPLRTPAEVKSKGSGHKRSRSLGESLKKMVGRNHKRRGSGHAIQVHNIVPDVKGPASLPTPSVTHTPVIRPHVRSATPAAATPVMRLFKSELQQQRSILPSSPRVHIVDLQQQQPSKCSSHTTANNNNNSHKTRSPAPCKRKLPGLDSPLATPPTPRGSMSSIASHDIPATLTSSLAASDNEETENQCNAENQFVQPGAVQTLQLGRLRKCAKSSILSTPDRKVKVEHHFISPISRSINKAPKTVKNNMMTPGSRVPMAMIQTP